MDEEFKQILSLDDVDNVIYWLDHKENNFKFESGTHQIELEN